MKFQIRFDNPFSYTFGARVSLDFVMQTYLAYGKENISLVLVSLEFCTKQAPKK